MPLQFTIPCIVYVTMIYSQSVAAPVLENIFEHDKFQDTIRLMTKLLIQQIMCFVCHI